MTYHLSKDEELRRLKIKLKEEIINLETNKSKCNHYKKVISNGISNVKIYKDKISDSTMNIRKIHNRVNELKETP